jgi:hypothetical protein
VVAVDDHQHVAPAPDYGGGGGGYYGGGGSDDGGGSDG